MIQDTQEYLQHWEKENNPFYPNEMRWDRLQVNRFLKDYKEQLILPDVGKAKRSVVYGCYQPNVDNTKKPPRK